MSEPPEAVLANLWRLHSTGAMEPTEMNAPQDHDGRDLVRADVSRRALIGGLGGGLAAMAAGAAATHETWAAPIPAMEQATPIAQTGVAALTGSWTYRSFLNNPTAGVAFNSLRFAEAELIIDPFELGSFTGRLMLGSAAEMALVGASSFGNPFTVRFQGRGVSEGIEDFVYDYVGYLVPVWPNGVNQVPAIVGSVVRTEPHAGGEEVGVVASFIAVKRD
jgi:hypothetical protein